VWDALADTREQAANLPARAELMQKIAAIVQKTAGPRRRIGAQSPSLDCDRTSDPRINCYM